MFLTAAASLPGGVCRIRGGGHLEGHGLFSLDLARGTAACGVDAQQLGHFLPDGRLVVPKQPNQRFRNACGGRNQNEPLPVSRPAQSDAASCPVWMAQPAQSHRAGHGARFLPRPADSCHSIVARKEIMPDNHRAPAPPTEQHLLSYLQPGTAGGKRAYRFQATGASSAGCEEGRPALTRLALYCVRPRALATGAPANKPTPSTSESGCVSKVAGGCRKLLL